jgi:hypothetical protein
VGTVALETPPSIRSLSADVTMEDVQSAALEKHACRKDATKKQYGPRVDRFLVS